MSQDVMVPPIEELRQVQRMTYRVHNAGDELFEQQLAGIWYRIEPHSDLEITDRLDYPRDKKTGKFLVTIPDRFGNRTGMPDPQQPKIVPEGGDAYTILRTLFSDGFECDKRGLCIVRGDGRDRERQEAAWQNYVTGRCERAKRKQAAWNRQVEMLTAGGALPPIMPKHIREDVAFLARYEYGTVAVQRAKYIAWNGSIESDDKSKVVEYIQHIFPRDWAEKGEAGCIRVRDEFVPQPAAWTPPARAESASPKQEIEALPKPEQVGPAVDAPEDLSWMIDEAKGLGVTLSGPDLLVLRAGTDQVAVMAIGERLIAAKAAKRKAGA
jgi:hypothetical protein